MGRGGFTTGKEYEVVEEEVVGLQVVGLSWGIALGGVLVICWGRQYLQLMYGLDKQLIAKYAYARRAYFCVGKA